LFGDYMATHQLPAYSRATSRLQALGQPKSGGAAWTKFLTSWEDWVYLNEGFVHGVQQGDEVVNLDARHRAWLRMKPLAALTGTTVCLSVTG